MTIGQGLLVAAGMVLAAVGAVAAVARRVLDDVQRLDASASLDFNED